MPLLNVVVSASSKPVAGASPKSKSPGLPLPTISGYTHRCSSSSRPWLSNSRETGPKPYWTMWSPGASFIRVISARTSPSMTWVLLHSGSFSVVETTYLDIALM